MIILEDPQELHHLRDVLRLRAGDPVECFDGAGREYAGTIAQVLKRSVRVAIDRERAAPSEPLMTWLLPALVKGDRFDWLVQKATELGVARISPIVTRHGTVRVAPEQGRAKGARWRRIAQEAAKQCGRSRLPVIDEPQPFESAVASLQHVPLALIPTLAATAIPLAELLKSRPATAETAVLIGPEGDFSRDEIVFAERHGVRPVSLGPLVLRSETAAIALVAILRYAQGGMG